MLLRKRTERVYELKSKLTSVFCRKHFCLDNASSIKYAVDKCGARIRENQAGFRGERECVDQILVNLLPGSTRDPTSGYLCGLHTAPVTPSIDQAL